MYYVLYIYCIYVYNRFVSILAGSYMNRSVFSLTRPLSYAPIDAQQLDTVVYYDYL